MSEEVILSVRSPDLKKFIDKDILDEFEGTACFYGDIINVQLNRTLTKHLEMLEKLYEKLP